MSNHIVFDIINDKQLSNEIKSEVSDLINWSIIHEKFNVSVYSLYHDHFKCIFNSAICSQEQVLQSLQSWQVEFISEGCTLRPVLKACINSINSQQIYYISNNPQRWTPEMQQKLTPFFINSAPDGHFAVTSINSLFKDLFDSLISLTMSGVLIISNEGRVVMGKSYELSIQLAPVLIPQLKVPDVLIELCIERMVALDSVRTEYVYGMNWIVYSTDHDFCSLCEAAYTKNQAIICTCDFDFDVLQSTEIAGFYVLFPSNGSQANFLMKKSAFKDVIRNMSLPPLGFGGRRSEVVEFVYSNFECQVYSPAFLQNGMHRYIATAIGERLAKTDKEEKNRKRKGRKQI